LINDQNFKVHEKERMADRTLQPDIHCRTGVPGFKTAGLYGRDNSTH
jgi:hypothetical protein